MADAVNVRETSVRGTDVLTPMVEFVAVSVHRKPALETWAKLAKGVESRTYVGGRFFGPLIEGEGLQTIVSGNYIPEKKSIQVLALGEIVTNDGCTIYKTDCSVWRGNGDAIERLIAGIPAADSEFYLVGIVSFSVSHSRYKWLEQGDYLTRGLVEGDELRVSVFRLIRPHYSPNPPWVLSQRSPPSE